MPDDFRRELRDAFGVDGEAPLDEIVAKGRRLRQRRRRAVVAGGPILLLLGVLALNQIHGSRVSVHVVGTPGLVTATAETSAPTPASTFSPSVVSTATQRDVAIYSALLRYEIGKIMPTGTATAPMPSPSDSQFYVQNLLFDLAPTSTTKPAFTAGSAGPVPTAVQEGIVHALAPTPLGFVPDPQVVALPCATSRTHYVFRFGPIPPTGEQVQVYLGYVFSGNGGGGHDAVYALAHRGQAWTVIGPVGAQQNTLGICG